MATDAELRYLVSVQDRDLKELQKNVRDLNKSVGTDAPAAAVKAGEGHSKAWGRVKLAAAAGGVALIAGAKSSIDAASDLNEQVSKIGVVFKGAGPSVVAFSETTAKSIGISQRAALEAAGTFGNMLVPMGIAPTAAGKLSTSLVKLAGDMASFNNASPEDVMEALRSGLSGESEPLRKFGVFLNADRVAAEAFALGLAKPVRNADAIATAHKKVELATRNLSKAIKDHGKDSDEAIRAQIALDTANRGLNKALDGQTPKLTAAQKAQATYSLIMKDTTAAQGDFTRTASSAANRERTMAAETENLRAKIGTALLPAYQALLGVLLQATGFMSQHTQAMQIAIGVIAGLVVLVYAVSAAQAVWNAAKVVGTAIQTVYNSVQAEGTVRLAVATAATTAFTVAQWLLNAAMSANPLVLVAILLAALAAAVVVAYRRSETFRNVVNSVWNSVRAVAAPVINFIRTAAPAAFQAVLTFVRSHWRLITALVLGPFAPIVAILAVAISHLGSVKSGLAWIRDNAGQIFSNFKSRASGPLGTVRDALSGAASAASSFAGALQSAWNWASNLISKLGSLASKLSSIGGLLDKVNPLSLVRSVSDFDPRTLAPRVLAPASLAPFAPGAGAGGSSGPITAYITIHDARDPVATARAVRTELIRIGQRNGAGTLGGTA